MQGEINPLTDFLQVENDDVDPSEVVKRTNLQKRVVIDHTSIAGNLAKAHIPLDILNGASRIFFLRREAASVKIMGSSAPFNFQKHITPERKVAISA